MTKPAFIPQCSVFSYRAGLRYTFGSCIHSHSRIAISCCSSLWSSRPLKFCCNGTDKYTYTQGQDCLSGWSRRSQCYDNTFPMLRQHVPSVTAARFQCYDDNNSCIRHAPSGVALVCHLFGPQETADSTVMRKRKWLFVNCYDCKFVRRRDKCVNVSAIMLKKKVGTSELHLTF